MEPVWEGGPAPPCWGPGCHLVATLGPQSPLVLTPALPRQGESRRVGQVYCLGP